MSECDAAGRAEIDQLMRTIPPMDATVAATLLREAKEVFDELGVVFFLRQGTCLGAVRDGAFIPWGRRYRPRLHLRDARPNQGVGGVRGRGLQGSRFPR